MNNLEEAMQIHVMYLPLIFTLGMFYENWRRRRLFKTRMRAITTGTSKDVEETKELLKKVKERFYTIKRD